MPILPSGQHVAVDPAPRSELSLDSASPFNARHIMAIEQADDLFRWLELLTLKPADEIASDDRRQSTQDASLA